jgi:hypothetical protein
VRDDPDHPADRGTILFLDLVLMMFQAQGAQCRLLIPGCVRSTPDLLDSQSISHA